MKLLMYIGNDLIEAIVLDDERIPQPGYVGNIKRCMKVKYKELIQEYSTPPEFLVTDPLVQNKQANIQRN